jgi:RNA polymerase sigma-70 factor (ECF subfamily)
MRSRRSIVFFPINRSARGCIASWPTRRWIWCAGGKLPETIPMPFRDPGESDELRRRLNQALTKLTERQRAVIVLHDVEGFTHGEIGEMLGIPEGTARSDLHHARAALRRILKDVRGDL